MIPYADRPVLHLRIATWLEQHAPLAFSAHTAEHFAAGGAPEAAYAHYLAAADLATSREDAITTYDLYAELGELGLPPALAAEGALALAQAAMSFGDDARAHEALVHAAGLIRQCPPEEAANLQLVLEQLRSDLALSA